jgi:hypothetical protein
MKSVYTREESDRGGLCTMFLDLEGLDIFISNLEEFRTHVGSILALFPGERQRIRVCLDFRIDASPEPHPLHDESTQSVMCYLGSGLLQSSEEDC